MEDRKEMGEKIEKREKKPGQYTESNKEQKKHVDQGKKIKKKTWNKENIGCESGTQKSQGHQLP